MQQSDNCFVALNLIVRSRFSNSEEYSRDRMIGSRTSDSLSATFPSNRKTDIYKRMSYIYIELKGPDEMKTVSTQ